MTMGMTLLSGTPPLSSSLAVDDLGDHVRCLLHGFNLLGTCKSGVPSGVMMTVFEDIQVAVQRYMQDQGWPILGGPDSNAAE